MLDTVTASNTKCAKCGFTLGPTGCFTVVDGQTFHASCAPPIDHPENHHYGRIAAIKGAVRKWTKASHIRLHAGEMTREEMRSVQAVVNAISREVEAL